MFDFMLPKVPQVKVGDLIAAMQKKQEFVLLDVRTPGEYSREKIKDSINVPSNEVKGKIEALIPDKQKKIYVYCLSGSRSVFAVEEMIKLGYKNVVDVKNGLLAWRVSKYPISR